MRPQLLPAGTSTLSEVVPPAKQPSNVAANGLAILFPCEGAAAAHAEGSMPLLLLPTVSPHCRCDEETGVLHACAAVTPSLFLLCFIGLNKG